jgi:hypothetical protein
MSIFSLVYLVLVLTPKIEIGFFVQKTPFCSLTVPNKYLINLSFTKILSFIDDCWWNNKWNEGTQNIV